ncbi:STAS domain-containing protein [Paracraurococcus ruber]|uniref:Anti-sigma factor antagonist n=1 Tax=Paracraurococcus ruber TaxID=77675 RepID=A0ABS1D2Q8_9PROT|nr:STAS domain-containing protein [Paracraurococcus ruber]MBK1661121.1 hypothetical protein [Paracraurococcus ruber]TDG22549.1 anti-sigma factor antagonist [Paracraurococcus ruber]
MQVTEVSASLQQIALSGFLDAAAVERLEPQFAAAVAAADRDTILDLSGVDYCGSLGIRMMLAAAKALQKRGRKLVLAAPQPPVRTVLETVGIGSLVPMTASVGDARHQLGA